MSPNVEAAAREAYDETLRLKCALVAIDERLLGAVMGGDAHGPSEGARPANGSVADVGVSAVVALEDERATLVTAMEHAASALLMLRLDLLAITTKAAPGS